MSGFANPIPTLSLVDQLEVISEWSQSIGSGSSVNESGIPVNKYHSWSAEIDFQGTGTWPFCLMAAEWTESAAGGAVLFKERFLIPSSVTSTLYANSKIDFTRISERHFGPYMKITFTNYDSGSRTLNAKFFGSKRIVDSLKVYSGGSVDIRAPADEDQGFGNDNVILAYQDTAFPAGTSRRIPCKLGVGPATFTAFNGGSGVSFFLRAMGTSGNRRLIKVLGPGAAADVMQHIILPKRACELEIVTPGGSAQNVEALIIGGIV